MRALLAKIPLFQGVSASRLAAAGSTVELRRFRTGETIFSERQPADSVWVIQRGWVHLVRRAPQGTLVTIFTVTAEEALCGFSAAVGQGCYYACAVAATDTTAIRIPRAIFADLLRREPGFAQRVLATYHTRMRHMAEAISLAQAPVEQRLAYALLRLKASFGRTIPITHQALARMAGTRWETSIRTIAAFRRKRWLSTSRGKMTIVRPERLQALLTSTAQPT